MKFFKLLAILLASAICDGKVWAPKIHNGQDAHQGEFPYMIQLRKPDGAHQCGAALITPKIVLTAAHCVDHRADLSRMEVIAGQHRHLAEAGESNDGTEQHRRIERAILYPGFQGAIEGKDIALVVLDRELELGDAVEPILIPKSDTSLTTQAVLIGWGHMITGDTATTLQKVGMTIFETSNCRSFLSGTLCAGTVNSDACNGDSGGPLACSHAKDSNKKYICGIVSWGRIACDDSWGSNAGVYTNVTYYYDWIVSEVEKLSINQVCPGGFIDCGNSFCVPNKFMNDGFDDCGNNFDEQFGCGGVFSVRSNSTTKIVYKDNETYSNNEFCVWTLNIHTNVQIISVLTNATFDSKNDGLVLYTWSGNGLQSLVLNANHTTLEINGPYAFLVFSSDFAGVGPGFSIEIQGRGTTGSRQGSAYILRDPAGNFTYVPPANSETSVTMTRVSLVVQAETNGWDTKREVLVEELNSQRRLEVLEIYTLLGLRSKYQTYWKTGWYSGNYNSTTSITLPGITTVYPTLFIFSSSNSGANSGFRIAWREPSCAF